jgi:hypothetical protein
MKKFNPVIKVKTIAKTADVLGILGCWAGANIKGDEYLKMVNADEVQEIYHTL